VFALREATSCAGPQGQYLPLVSIGTAKFYAFNRTTEFGIQFGKSGDVPASAVGFPLPTEGTRRPKWQWRYQEQSEVYRNRFQQPVHDYGDDD
jgi:hypothetical protein